VKAAGIAERSGKNWSASAECGVAHNRANVKPHGEREKIPAYETSIGDELSTMFSLALLLFRSFALVGSTGKISPVVNDTENERKRDEQSGVQSEQSVVSSAILKTDTKSDNINSQRKTGKCTLSFPLSLSLI